MSKAGRTTIAAAAVCAFGLALAPHVDAQKIKREPIARIDSVAGAANFKAYCTVCHGVGGKGNGPAAGAMKTPPADLTLIAKRHHGQFPAAEVKAMIRGDATLAAHGTREMPMWGPVFRSADSAEMTELRLANLVNYLESLQEK